MAKTIGDRIKEKRKELGLTQLELANKIGVTDRAVSKWEQNEGNPDISILPVLADLFDVSLDYLMTGKNAEEKIVTMSKMELCAKKDSPALLGTFELSSIDEDKKGLWHYIVKYDSVNVFNALVQKKQAREIFNIRRGDDYLNEQHKEITYFLVVTNNLKELAQFGFSDIGYVHPDQLSDKTLKALMGDKRVKDSTREYVLTSHKRDLFKGRNDNFKSFNNCFKGNAQIIYPFLLSKAVDFKEWDFAKSVLDAIADANAYIGDLTAKEKINWDDPNLRKADINCKKVVLLRPTDEINPYSYIDSNGHSIHYFYAIGIDSEILNKILKAHKYDLLENANEICRRIKMETVTKRNIELEKVESSSKSETEKIKYRAVNNGIVVPSVLIESKDLKLIREIIDNNYYHYYEFVYDCLTTKKQKVLYRFFIDNNFEDLAGELAEGPSKYSRILGECWSIFNASQNDEMYKNHKALMSAQNSIESVKEECRYNINENTTKLFNNLLIEKIKALKESIYTRVNNDIEAEKQAERDRLEKAKIVKGLTKEYFENLLANDGTELFIIKLCSLLDAILKFDFKYEGEDFFARLTAHLNAGPKSRDCDDGWGYMVRDIKYDEEVVFPWERLGNLLNRLRIQRNNIAHSESNKVEELNEAELRECLEYVFSINKKEN